MQKPLPEKNAERLTGDGAFVRGFPQIKATGFRKGKGAKGFSLMELAVTVAIVGGIIAIGVPALKSIRQDSVGHREDANIKTLNEAAERARIAGMEGPGTSGSDEQAALNWYLAERFLQGANNVSLDGIFFLSGVWEKSAFPSEADIIAAIAPTMSTPEEDISTMLQNFGASSPEELAAWYGYANGDMAGMLAAYGVSTVDELAQMQGYATYEEWVMAWWGYDPGQDTVASWMGYFGAGDPTAMAVASGYSSFQEMATSLYQSAVTPELTNEQFQEISTMLPQISLETFSSVFQNLQNQEPLIGDNFVLLQNSFATNLAAGNLQSWSQGGTQAELWNMLQTAMSQNTAQGTIMPLLDFSVIDLTGRDMNNTNLANSNITGVQLNGVASLVNAKLNNMDLTGFNPTGINIQRTDFRGTNITAAQLQASLVGRSANLMQTNLEGIPLAGLNLAGADIYGANLTGTGITGTQLNGVTRLNAVNLTGADLTGLNLTGKSLGSANLSYSNMGIHLAQQGAACCGRTNAS